MGRDMVISRYAISTGIPRAEGLSTGPLGLGCHRCIIKFSFHKHTGPYLCTFYINVCLHRLVRMNNRYTVQ